MSESTPGPWEVAGHCIRSPFAHGDPEKRGFLIAECSFGSMPADANARLIAAAPELLEALAELLAAEEAVFPPFEAGAEAQDAWAIRQTNARYAAAQAIAKATGAPQ